MKPKNSTRAPLTPLVLAISLMLGACAADKPIVPPPLVKPRAEVKAELIPLDGNPTQVDSTPRETTITSTPKPPEPGPLSTIKTAKKPPLTADSKEEATVTVAFDQMPLPNFVQAIYGLILKRTYSMDPQVSVRKDLVTLRASTLQTPTQIESAARMLLKTYGVAVSDLGAGNYRISPDNSQTGYAPEILRGRALPDVPMALRPIYQIVEMNAVRSSDLAAWLTKVFGSKVSIQDDAGNNALILSGQSDEVSAVLSAIHVLDQPLMKGRLSQRINPAFWSADELSRKLVELLSAEGYRATIGPAGNFPINLISIPGVNAIIVFANDPAVMRHIADWARDFDKPSPSRGSGGGYFTYKVRYTSAESLARTMQAVMGDPAAQAPAQQPIPAGAIVVGPATPIASNKIGRVIVNAATNTLIFQGGGSDNPTQLLSLLQELDKPARAALIEVTVAEVTLDNTTQLGVEWALVNSGANIVGGTLGGIALGGGLVTSSLGTGTKGLTTAYLGGAGDVRALLNFLATSTNSNVLSRPSILVRSGETASIQVGSEIPTIQQQQTTAATAGSTGVLQSVQYRKTGIILNVKPTIYAGDRIDLDVTQEVSDSTKVGVAGSPIIDTRKIDTKLPLQDGMPVLLGGLISQKNSRSDVGVPLLKDIPLVGQLFRTNTDNNFKTELLILITPYIVADDHDAKAITDAFRNQLGDWARAPDTPAKPTPTANGGVTNRQTPP
jgi:general secretion pathway protein D